METLHDARRESILGCLDKILADQSFRSSARLSDFLRYIVVETLEGRGSRLKGYSIAVSVFECGANFDPQTNSVVRVEATRLRKHLAAYYESAGKDDPIEIRVNRGTYNPEFIDRPAASALTDPMTLRMLKDETDDARPDGRTPPAQNDVSRPLRYAVPAALAASVMAGLIWLAIPQGGLRKELAASKENPLQGSNRAWKLPPSIAIAETRFPPGGELQNYQSAALNRELEAALGRFENLRVMVSDFAGRTKDPSVQPDYHLTSSMSQTVNGATVSFLLVSMADTQVIWSKTYTVQDGAMNGDVRAQIVANIASTLGRSHGVIFADRFRRLPPISTETSGHECIMHSFKYLNTPSLALFRASRDCLERSIAMEPGTSASFSALALALLDGYLKGFDDAPANGTVLRALQLANTAVERSPSSSRAHLALATARFYDRRFEDAFEAAQHAIQLNPNSNETKGRVGGLYVLRGDFDKGLALLKDVASNAEIKANWLSFYFFLHAYMNDNAAAARKFARRTSSGHSALGILSRILIASRDGKTAESEQSRAQLAEKFPEFSANIKRQLERAAMAEPIRLKMLNDLRAAGLNVD